MAGSSYGPKEARFIYLFLFPYSILKINYTASITGMPSTHNHWSTLTFSSSSEVPHQPSKDYTQSGLQTPVSIRGELHAETRRDSSQQSHGIKTSIIAAFQTKSYCGKLLLDISDLPPQSIPVSGAQEEWYINKENGQTQDAGVHHMPVWLHTCLCKLKTALRWESCSLLIEEFSLHH